MVSVGPFAHHLRAYCVEHELVANDFQMTPDGSSIHREGSEYGFSGPFADAYSEVAAPLAAAVRRALHGECTSPIWVHHLGLYRQIEIEEIVPTDDPGPVVTRHAVGRRGAMMANESLTQSLGPVTEGFWVGQGEDADFCGATRDCHPVPQWIDARPDREGRPRLRALMDEWEGVEASVRKRFAAATLASARRLLRSQSALDVSELSAQKEPGLVPPDADDSMAFDLSLDAPGVSGVAGTVPFTLGEALRGDVHGETHLRVNALPAGDFSLKVTVHAQAAGVGDPGRRDVTLTVEYWLSGPRVATHESAPFHLTAAIDGARVLPLGTPQVDSEWSSAHPGALDGRVSTAEGRAVYRFSLWLH